MKKLLTFLVKEMTGIKDFDVDKAEENGVLNYTIKVPEDSIGLIIGKKGKTIRAMRNIVKVRATLKKKRIGLSVDAI